LFGAIDGSDALAPTLQLTCRDCGVDCDWTTSDETVDKIIGNSAQHAVQGHGTKELPAEMMESMRRTIKDL